MGILDPKPISAAAIATQVANPASVIGSQLTATYGLPKLDKLAVTAAARFLNRAKSGNAVKIVGVGDSVTAGTGATLGTNDYLTLVRNALAAQFPAATVTQSNRALSGSTVATNVINSYFANAITDAGDLYILMFGKNDTVADAYPGQPVQGYALAQSMRGLEVMIREIRRRVPKADIIIAAENPNTATDTTGNTNLRAWNLAAKNLADAYGCQWVDCYTAYTDKGSYSTYLSDAVHPSVAGHQLIADTIMAALPANPIQTVGAPGRPSADAGVYNVTTIDAASGLNGWNVVQATGANRNGSWLNTGTWTGPNPYATSTATDYAEFKFQGTELMVRMSTASADALVLDITIDGVTTSNQSMTVIASAFQPFVLIAKDLTATQHTVRLTLKSGTLKIYQAAWLNASQIVPATPTLRAYMSSRYYGQEPYSPTTNNPASGAAYIVPFFVPMTKGFNQVAVDVTNPQAGSTINIGLYGSGDGDQPFGLIADFGAVDSSTSGFKTLTISQLLTPGWYWLAYMALGATPPSVRSNAISHALVTSTSTSTISAFNGYLLTGQTALPQLWPTSTTAVGLAPRVLIRPS